MENSTFIEVLVVIATISILACVVLASLEPANKKSEEDKPMVDAMSIGCDVYGYRSPKNVPVKCLDYFGIKNY